jgi:hypothetical protein
MSNENEVKKEEVKPKPPKGRTVTPQQLQQMMAQRQQGIPMPTGNGAGKYINFKDEVISLFFLAQQGIMTSEEVRKEINLMKKNEGLSEISVDEWTARYAPRKQPMPPVQKQEPKKEEPAK